jgi:hypothetical protein
VRRRTRIGSAAIIALVVLVPAVLRGHNTVRASLVCRPQAPRAGEVWHVTASVDSSDGLVHPGRRLTVTADMAAHHMRPIAAEMTRTDAAGRAFSGQLSFTMPGPWQLTLRSEDLNEVLVGVFAFEVANDDDPRAVGEVRTVVDLIPPPHPNLIPPAWAAAGTIGLTIAFEIVATRYQRRRERRSAERV